MIQSGYQPASGLVKPMRPNRLPAVRPMRKLVAPRFSRGEVKAYPNVRYSSRMKWMGFCVWSRTQTS